MQAKTLKRISIATIVAAAIAVGYAVVGGRIVNPVHALDAPMASSSPVVQAPVASWKAGLPDFSAIVDRDGPAVVNISVTATGKRSFERTMPFPQLDPDDPFFEFFKRFQAPEPQGGAPSRSVGSGFIVSPDGLVLTNAHVVDGADEVTVKLTDRRELKAKVLGVDKVTDIAVLRIPGNNFPTVKMAGGSQTRVGEWVLAIGSPFGFENSVSAGIVSAKSRSLPGDGYVPFIQTDVAVNPGNSGGPLINLNGEVVGINSQIYSRSGGYQGLSFAIPIDVALNIKNQLVQHGKVSHGRMGVTIQEVNQSLAQSFGLDKPVGALVASVEPDGPAAKAGIETGDIILKFNGATIDRSGQLPPLVANVDPGASTTVQVWRKGGTRELRVTLGELDSGSTVAAASTEKGRLGVAVRSLSAEEKRRAQVDSGLVVEDAAGAAARAGIQPGDIVLAVNGQAVKDANQLRSLIEHAGQHVALLIQRNDAKIFVPVDLG